MPTSNTRKKVRKLLRELWELQTEDVPMTASTLLKIKYLLGSTTRCDRVDVFSPKFLADLPASPLEITDSRLPQFVPTSQFVRCQLEDQKLTGARSHNCQQDPVALPAILAFVNLVCSPNGASRKFSHATQFRWHCPLTHRTHVIFAFIDFKMRSRVYSVEELLNLRTYALSEMLPGIPQGNELAEMVCNKSRVNSVSSRSYNSTSLKRDKKKAMDESSTASEEVVFRGNMIRRAIRQDPPPANTADNTQERPSNSTPGLSDQSVAAAVIHAPDPPPQMEWKYRGRSGSEVLVNEPLPAPTGLTAQHSEGFQRFYKAVVSPTHVRVTAGGRIVPNTRNPASPTAKRPKDTEYVTAQEKAESCPAPAPTTAPKQPAAVMGMPQPMPFFYPGYPGLPPMHPMTGMPMPMMPPGFTFPMPVPVAPTAHSTEEATRKENQSRKAEEHTSEPQSGKPGINLSPPEQFDHTKPFMYNGQQWMFPMYPAPYPGFIGMPPPGYAGHMPAPPMMMPPQMPMPPIMSPMGPMPQGGPMGPVGHQQPAGASAMSTAPPSSSRQSTPQPPSKPPISSIRPSQITRKQIDGLRANLKYHEDQLQYNKHQIDERDMERKIDMLNHDIERFEKVFQAQTGFEEKHYPKNDKDKDEAASSSGRSSVPSSKTQSQSEESKESKATTMSSNSHSQPKLRKKDRSRDSVGINSNKSSNASYTLDDSAHDRLLASMQAGKTSSLPSGAARAPVFQPRSVSTLSCPVPSGNGQAWEAGKAESGITQEQLEAAEKKLVAAGSKAWGVPHGINGTSSQPSRGGSPRGSGGLGVPYLVGTLPRGFNPYGGYRVEYEYSRKLTDEELQARHLYFGKASRSVGQGLPKYDGRNFYPPSPAKHITPNESPSVGRGRAPVGEPGVDYRFAAPGGREIDPFRAVAPIDTFPKGERAVVSSKASSVKSTQSFSSQTGDHVEGFKKALEESKKLQDTDVSCESVSEASVNETKSLDFNDSRSNGNSSKLWQSMVKRGFTASDVLPSTVTSTTAQGYLPHFAGNASASLSPTVSDTVTCPIRGSSVKGADTNPNGSTFMAPKSGENAPPVPADRISISDTIRSMVGMKSPAWAH
ncbi:hypothetical protein DHEL01_v203920 [Diaporthe helianthi]|uniref:Uncharacterized protein n=1 Tax=Diaporthe helianthi TaxID=158607 RepID=A0A2P5I5F9_DIAHE|nr:hypothetical protein DHEL01_v203920 [Diaporthe helianthi]